MEKLRSAFRLLITGTGGFSQNVYDLLRRVGLDVDFFIDDFNAEDFNGRHTVRSKSYSPTPNDIIFIAIANPQHIFQTVSRLQKQGVSLSQIICFDSESPILLNGALVLLETMLNADAGEALALVSKSQGRFQCWEDNFFNREKKPPEENQISVRLFGSRNGFLPHLGDIPERLKSRYSVNLIREIPSFDAPHVDKAHLIASRLTMTKIPAELVICASLSPCAPKSTKKLTLTHLLYDSPLFNSADYGLRQPNQHFVAVPTQAQMRQLQSVCNKFELRNVTLIPAGYPKLDLAIADFKSAEDISSPILLYAPTECGTQSRGVYEGALSLFCAHGIIESILDEFPTLGVVVRPYPDDLALLDSGRAFPAKDSLLRLVGLCQNHPRVELDSSSTHTRSYEKAAILMTDFSSTAYSFAFTTEKPILFLSNPVIEKTELWRSTEYFQDREMVGKVVFNAVDVAESIADILNNSRQYNQKIVSLRDRQLFNLGRSEEYLLECVDCIISGYSRPEWWTIEDKQ